MIGRAACRLRDNPVEPQSGQIEVLDKNVDHPNWIVLTDALVEAGGKQDALAALLALDKPRSLQPMLQEPAF
jgi:hypothetical protein